MKINKDVFEKLLFELNNNVYKAIDDLLENYKDILKVLIDTFNLEYNTYFEKKLENNLSISSIPKLDILLCYQNSEDLTISSISKSTNYILNPTFEFIPLEKIQNLPTSDLIVRFYHKNIEQNFIIPLAFILGYNSEKILKNGYYQVYTHQIYPKSTIDTRNYLISKGICNFKNDFEKDAYTYIGITKRNWKKRFEEHLYASRNGSYLRFHRCLRSEFFEIGAIDHIIDRAGITEKEAMEIEEKNIEKQSLYPIFQKGLNMIPGGKAGLRFIHEYARRTGYKIEKELEADIFESELIKIQNHNLNTIASEIKSGYKNDKLAELWAKDIEFRIKAITNHENHFSYKQIQAARILFAAGWNIEKIFENLENIDNKIISKEQLKKTIGWKNIFNNT